MVVRRSELSGAEFWNRLVRLGYRTAQQMASDFGVNRSTMFNTADQPCVTDQQERMLIYIEAIRTGDLRAARAVLADLDEAGSGRRTVRERPEPAEAKGVRSCGG